MSDELMSCLTCLRVQRQADMLLVENPARDRASMSSFRLCMGCASAIVAALAATKGFSHDGTKSVLGDEPRPTSDRIPADSPGGDSDPGGVPEHAEKSPPAIDRRDAESGALGKPIIERRRK